MPPKTKKTKEEIVAAALNIVRQKGAEALTAREVGAALGVSTRPIFTFFQTMNEMKAEMRKLAEDISRDYIERGLAMEVPFLGVGLQYIRFAKDEPELYKMLFLTSPAVEGSGAMELMGRLQRIVREPIQRIYHMNAVTAERYFRDMWLVVHSLATLIVTGGCRYSEEEISSILTGFSLSVCKAYKEIPGFAESQFNADAEFRKLLQQD